MQNSIIVGVEDKKEKDKYERIDGKEIEGRRKRD